MVGLLIVAIGRGNINLPILTFKGYNVSIVAVHDGEKVYSIFGRDTDAWNDYVKVNSSGLSSNSNRFTTHR